MLYIGFSDKSHKKYTHIFCRKYKHCAPVFIHGKQVFIYQFVRINKTEQIRIKHKDLKILEQYGWKFIKCNFHPKRPKFCLTCVQFTKQICGIKNIKIQTPDALLKYVEKK